MNNPPVTKYLSAGGQIFCLFLLLVLFLSLVIPLSAILKGLFLAGKGTEGFNFQVLFRDIANLACNDSIQKSILNTFLQAACSTLIAMAMGIPMAFFCAKRKFPGKRILTGLSSVPLCIPPLILVLAFVRFFGMNGFINKIISGITGEKEPALTFLYSFRGIILLQGFYNFPLIMTNVASLWSRLPTREEDAAYLLGKSRIQVFFSVTLYKILPGILSSSILVFLYCFFSFIIVLLLSGVNFSVLEVEIYSTIRMGLDIQKGCALAILETVIALLFIIFYLRLENKTSGLFGYTEKNTPEKIKSPGEKIILILFLVLIFLFLAGPLFAMILNGLDFSKGFLVPRIFSNYTSLFSNHKFYTSLGNTLITGVSTATLSVICALTYSILIFMLKPSLRQKLKVLGFLPTAISGVVIGLGWLLLPGAKNITTLILAQSVVAFPFAFIPVYSSIEKISPDILDAAKMLGSSKGEINVRIIIPIIRKSIFIAWIFAFAVSAGDATLPIVLGIPGFENLSLMLYRLSGAYRFGEASACGLILILITGVPFLIKKEEI